MLSYSISSPLDLSNMLQLLRLRVKLVQHHPVTHWRSSLCHVPRSCAGEEAACRMANVTTQELHWRRVVLLNAINISMDPLSRRCLETRCMTTSLFPVLGYNSEQRRDQDHLARLCPCFSYSLCRRRRVRMLSLTEVNKQILSSIFKVKMESSFSAFFIYFATYVCSSYICDGQRILLFLITLISRNKAFLLTFL